MHCDAAAVGHASNNPPAAPTAGPPVPEGDGAARLDAHAAQRAAAVVSAGHHHARQGDGRELVVGRREDGHHHVQFHAGLLLAHRI